MAIRILTIHGHTSVQYGNKRYKSNLLFVDGIPGELRQMDEFEMKSPELSQDAAPG